MGRIVLEKNKSKFFYQNFGSIQGSLNLLDRNSELRSGLHSYLEFRHRLHSFG